MDPNALCLWVHCNHCVRQTKDDPKLEMYFTNCGHFFCQHCVQKNTSPKCLVCGVEKVRTMVLGPNLSPDIRHMFQNTIRMPQMIHRAMEFQQKQVSQTLVLYRNKADKMTKEVRTYMDSCKMLKQQAQELDEEIKNGENQLQEMHEQMKRRATNNMNYQGHTGAGYALQHSNANMVGNDRQSSMHAASNWMTKRSETPGFSGMEVNAFDPKTPDAFKQGKIMLSNAVNLQAIQQGPSPGHVRNLFSPKGQEGMAQLQQRRLSTGSSGGRINTGLGLCSKVQSPYNTGRIHSTRSPNIGGGSSRGY